MKTIRCETYGNICDKAGWFQKMGISKKYYHFTKRGNETADIASWCSRECYNVINEARK